MQRFISIPCAILECSYFPDTLWGMFHGVFCEGGPAPRMARTSGLLNTMKQWGDSECKGHRTQYEVDPSV
jgi:hypothetical protein